MSGSTKGKGTFRIYLFTYEYCHRYFWRGGLVAEKCGIL